jgi:hypothetical protein
MPSAETENSLILEVHGLGEGERDAGGLSFSFLLLDFVVCFILVFGGALRIYLDCCS